MATSLQEQLRRLCAPQTSNLIDSRRKASILFGPEEAATIDRKLIYDLGVSGLTSLISLNPKFKNFQSTLFDEAAISLERSVENSDLNNALNLNIVKFLRLLSPYFQLRPAHLCLEWMIRRFQIHQYNREQLLALVLPYHETNICVKVLQCIQIKSHENEWGWLKPAQKSGVFIPKEYFISKATTDKFFYNFICSNTLAIISQWGSHAKVLQTHISFYVSVIGGAIHRSKQVHDWHITTLLPILLKGLRSQVLDFVTSSYTLASMLMLHSHVTIKLCDALNQAIISNIPVSLRKSALLLLVLIFESQKTLNLKFSEANLKFLISQDWIVPMLHKLYMENIEVCSFYFALVTQVISGIQLQEKSEDLKEFMMRLLSEIRLNHVDSLELIRCVLNANKTLQQNGTDSEMNQSTQVEKDYIKWYSEFLKKIEVKYPTAFDKVIEIELKSKQDWNQCFHDAFKVALGNRLDSFSADTTDIYESLYHYAVPVRLQATKVLVQNLEKLKKQFNQQVLKDCVADRLKDDCANIVAEILKISIDDFIDLLGIEDFIISVSVVINRIASDFEVYGVLADNIVTLLTSPIIIQNYDENLLFIMLMPMLLPKEDSSFNPNMIKTIVSSVLRKKIGFLKALSAKAKNFSDYEHYREVFVKELSVCPLNLKTIISSLRNIKPAFIKTESQLENILLISKFASEVKISPDECLEFYKFIKNCHKNLTKIFNGEQSKVKRSKLDLFVDFTVSLMANTRFEGLTEWDNRQEDLECIFTIMEDVLYMDDDLNSGSGSMKIINAILNHTFDSTECKLQFLTNLFYYPRLPLAVDYQGIQVMGIALFNAMISDEHDQLVLNKSEVFKLIVGLTSSSETIRCLVLETLNILKSSKNLDKNVRMFVEHICEYRQELAMDSEQLSLILFTILNKSESGKKNSFSPSKILKEMLELLGSQPFAKDKFFKVQLLKILRHINSEEDVVNLIGLGEFAINQSQSKDLLNILESPYDEIFQLIFDRFTFDNIENLLSEYPEVWAFFENVFNKNNVFLELKGKLVSLPCVALGLLDEKTFMNFPSKAKIDFIKLIIRTVSLSDNDEIFLDANKLLKKCVINCEPLVEVFINMYSLTSKSASSGSVKKRAKKQQKVELLSSSLDTSAPAWKEGVVLIELLDSKKNLENAHMLISPLFELLRVCVEIEEVLNVEYIKQTTLSLIMHCCKTAEADGFDFHRNSPELIFHVHFVVQCMRSSQNPQTHNNALMLLAHCAHIVPNQVLTEIVAIFTFMGNSVVRQEDAFSFHIINNIITSIVPILVTNNQEVSEALVVPVLNVFSDIMLDIPEHRRLLLYTKLLQTLGAEKFLWMFLCVLFDEQVANEEKAKQVNKTFKPNLNFPKKMNERLEIALDICNSFEPFVIVTTCINLFNYWQKLPLTKPSDDKASQERKSKSVSSLTTREALFDVNCRSTKELRHYRYLILQFISNITKSKDFLKKIALLSDEELVALKPLFQNLIIRTLTCIPAINTALETSQDPTQAKFWKVIINNLQDILDNAISLLSPEMFVLVISGLMVHQLMCIRKKSLDLLINKVQNNCDFLANCETAHFVCVLNILNDNIVNILENNDQTAASMSTDNIQICLSTLIAIKLIAKNFGLKFVTHLKELLVTITKALKNRSAFPKILNATMVITLGELISSLKAHSLFQMPKFITSFIEILSEQVAFLCDNLPDSAVVGVISGVQKCVESLPLFLGRFTPDIIVMFSKISQRLVSNKSNGKDQKSEIILQKINLIWNKLATSLTIGNLVQYCTQSFDSLMQDKCFKELILVFDLLKQNIKITANNVLIGVEQELTAFFLYSLEFRCKVSEANYAKNMTEVNDIENTIIDTVVTWVLKMSETRFRPIYHKMFKWGLKENPSKTKAVTYFALTFKISSALKTLFVLFAGEFINEAAQLLTECKPNETVLDAEAEHELSTELITSIMGTFTNVFSYDSKQFVTTNRFETLLHPIIDHLENTIVLQNEELLNLVIKCIAQFAVAVSNDVHWKQLNHEILMKTRSNVPEVRIAAFNCCVEIARHLGDDFSTLLPETVPFIAELFEDDNYKVEENTKKGILQLEGILGESLQKYL